MDLKNEYAGDLSGGQKKLLSLGRVFMLNPDMILLDEPTAGVNPTLTMQLMQAIKELQPLVFYISCIRIIIY